MADQWDDSIKRLFRDHPQDYVSWLMEGAIFRGMVSGELKNRTRHTDILMEVVKAGTEQWDTPVTGLLNVEIQSVEDPTIVQRLREYSMMAEFTYQQEVASFLLLLRPMASVPVSPKVSRFFGLYETNRFHFTVVKLWEIAAKDLLHTGLLGLFPLVSLTQGGTEQDILATTAAELFEAQQYDLIALAKLIAGLRMRNKIDQETLERMFSMYQDIIQESWVYQQIVEQGIGTGEQRALFTIIQKRFPEIVGTARQLIGNITDAGQLENLIAEVSVAQSAQEVLHILNQD